MHQPHVIRLHGPWEFEILSATPNADAPSNSVIPRVRWPADTGMLLRAGKRPGVVLLCRRFARPTGLEPRAAVALCISGALAGGEAYLNDRMLGDVPPRGALVRFDVTSLLLPRNQLMLKCPSPPPPGPDQQAGQPLLGEVRLEIDPA